jgi:hypothetical protein
MQEKEIKHIIQGHKEFKQNNVNQFKQKIEK